MSARYIPSKYEQQIPESSVPPEVRFDVPMRNRGQMVEVAYGTFGVAEAGPGDPYQRITDASDGSVKYYRLTQPGGWV